MFPAVFDHATTIRRRLASLLPMLASVLLLWFAVETLVYRSGAYYSLAEPESNAGAVVNALMLVQLQYRAQARNVLVLGDSRVAEGFSPSVAASGTDLNFIAAAVPGSTPRTWYLLLRELERRGQTFEAVMVGISAAAVGSRLADWPLSPLQDSPLLGWRDTYAYPDGFIDAGMRTRARQAVWFPAATMRADTLQGLADPKQRWWRVHDYRPGYLNAVLAYPGREQSLPHLSFNDASAEVIDWGAATPEQRQLIAAHLIEVRYRIDPALITDNQQYLRTWFGAMLRLCAARGTHLLAFALPRGPYPQAYADQISMLPTLQALDGLSVLPAELLRTVERPEAFFDTLHNNHVGRQQMSALLGAEVDRSLQPQVP